MYVIDNDVEMVRLMSTEKHVKDAASHFSQLSSLKDRLDKVR